MTFVYYVLETRRSVDKKNAPMQGFLLQLCLGLSSFTDVHRIELAPSAQKVSMMNSVHRLAL